MKRGHQIIEGYQNKTGQEIIRFDLKPNLEGYLMIDQLYELVDDGERRLCPYHPRALAKARQIIHSEYPEEC